MIPLKLCPKNENINKYSVTLHQDWKNAHLTYTYVFGKTAGKRRKALVSDNWIFLQ